MEWPSIGPSNNPSDRPRDSPRITPSDSPGIEAFQRNGKESRKPWNHTQQRATVTTLMMTAKFDLHKLQLLFEAQLEKTSNHECLELSQCVWELLTTALTVFDLG